MNVFEYGAGYSTQYFKKRCKFLYSVEHNPDWVNHLQDKKLNVVYEGQNDEPYENGKLCYKSYKTLKFTNPLLRNNTAHNIEHGLLNAEFARYASSISKFEPGFFDIVVVDGMARQLSGFYASKYIKTDGYIILDNSDRWQYNSLQKYLINAGFGRIDFWGLGPVNTISWCTSFFSRNFKISNIQILRKKKSGDLGW